MIRSYTSQLFNTCIFQSAPSLFLKSNFEYLRGNYRKAVKLLNSSNIAEHFGPIKTGKKLTGIPFCALLSNKRYELLYNCGVQLLHAARPLAAFECLMEAVQVYHSNPRLWLRLAECCISANKGGSEQESKSLPCKKGIVQSVIGTGYHRKIVLASQSSQNTNYSRGHLSVGNTKG
ncbi:CCR4-NOT transcription complex subunit 10 [Goodea atripinnis]|uniref:CCR4-NOT transcription complex subunit 10 n=1 Tax=Goodea atripinnis TaxID=208336 RepID=A0ABV0N1B3_9TELE